jgi:hypothetical protein
MYFKTAYISFAKAPLYTFEHFTPLHNSQVYEMRKGVIRTKRG